jgi:hypothetical protein
LMIAYAVRGYRSSALMASLFPLLLAFFLYVPVARLVAAAVAGRKSERSKSAVPMEV